MVTTSGESVAGLKRILCVDDDTFLTDLLAFALEREGYAVRTANRASLALQLIKADRPDAVILDVNLPDVDGLSLCGQLHRTYRLPVLLLTGRHSEDDQRAGFDQGADDYIAKPFNMQLLIYRLRSVLRRAGGMAPQVGDKQGFLQVGEAHYYAEYNQIVGREGRHQLTPIEGKILQLLVVNAGQVFPAERIMELVWSYDSESTVAVVKTHVRRLRQKLEAAVGRMEVIHTVPGRGYTYRQGLALVRPEDRVPRRGTPIEVDDYTDARGIDSSIATSS
jgi:DNA-binding response OmpR family regulator